MELIFYAPSYNPATLGFIDKDRLYLTSANNAVRPFNVVYTGEYGLGNPNFTWELVPGLYYRFNLIKAEIGYYFPMGERAGRSRFE